MSELISTQKTICIKGGNKTNIYLLESGLFQHRPLFPVGRNFCMGRILTFVNRLPFAF